MIFKLRKTLVPLLMLMPAGAYALGLGDIRLHSSLGQPLNAEIDLLSPEEGDLESIRLGVAPHEAFASAGIERPAMLNHLQLTVLKTKGGKHVVKLTTKEPVKEPFLDFLLEMGWRSGRLVREYTVLLDPPNMVRKEAPPQVSAPKTRPQPQPQQPPLVKAPKATPPAEPSVAKNASGGIEHTVKEGESLWKIAARVRPEDAVTTQQVMMALFKANPDAFYRGNANMLRKGYVLRLDDPSLISAMSHAEATKEVQRQAREWQDHRLKAAEEAKSRPSRSGAEQDATAVGVRDDQRLRLVAPEPEKSKTPAAASTPGVAGSNDPKVLRNELMLALENSEAQKRENTELKSRLQEVEGQLNSLQRLLELQSDTAAAVQANAAATAKAASQPVEKPAATTPVQSAAVVVPPPAEQKPVEAAKPVEQKPVEAAKPAEQKPAEAAKPAEQKPVEAAKPAEQTPVEAAKPAEQKPVEAAKPVEQKPAEAAKPAEQKPAEAAKPAEQKPAKPAEPKPAAAKPVAPAPAPEPDFIDSMLDSPLVLSIAGAVGLVLSGVGFQLWRRRRGAQPGEFQESILSGGTASTLAPREGGRSSEETSLFSDLAVSGMSTLQTEDSEVDPLTEADVYMAYGRHQQAEELLKNALKDEPERPELVAKLAEVYHSTKNAAEFLPIAEKLLAVTEGSGPHWERVAAMGRALLPNNPTFGSGSAEPVPLTSAIEMPQLRDDDVLDIGLDLDALAEEMESSHAQTQGDDMGLGLDFGALEKPAAKAPRPESEPAPESTSAGLGGLDFDLDSFAADEEAPAAPAMEFELPTLDARAMDTEPAVTAPQFDLGELELPVAKAASAAAETVEFDLGALESEPAPAAASKTPAATGLDLDFDLGDLGQETPAADLGGDGLGLEAMLAEMNEESEGADAEFETKAAAIASEAVSELSLDGDDDMFGDMDAVGTKLDLARAYIDMGDSEGARAILDEVVSEGTSTQQQEAKTLLAQIA